MLFNARNEMFKMNISKLRDEERGAVVQLKTDIFRFILGMDFILKARVWVCGINLLRGMHLIA